MAALYKDNILKSDGLLCEVTQPSDSRLSEIRSSLVFSAQSPRTGYDKFAFTD